ncbi:tetratricopeptide repeat protein [Argonema galeatum]|uniref:tetratricopeptide repeat protein n=1 Tax=Argonema galeatum TaxID=2942762 RepID=UPI002012DB00|nr:tetratricopeptide repeat protein [Argonema galeatum]MCL1464514.1 tetratricopeptide repeat protein [Argonema galeatum A003/A1]
MSKNSRWTLTMQYRLTFINLFTATLILCVAANLVPNSYYRLFNSAKAQIAPLTPNLEADRLLEMGVVQAQNGELDDAADMFQRVLALSKYIGDRERQEISLSNLAVVYRQLGQSPKATEFYQQAFAVLRNPDILIKLAKVYQQSNNRLKALESYQKALAIYKQIGNSDRETDILTTIGDLDLELGLSSQALYAYEQALEIYRRQQNCRSEDKILKRMGQLYERIGQNNLAQQMDRLVVRQQGDRNRRCIDRIVRFPVTASPTMLRDNDSPSF